MSSLPILTSVSVICRERLSRYNSSLPHVVALINEYANQLFQRWSVRRACKFGLSRRALEALAAHNRGWNDNFSIAEAAVTGGFVHVLQWLNDCKPSLMPYISASFCDQMRTDASVSSATTFSVLQWLCDNRNEKFPSFVLVRAVENRRLGIVRWLLDGHWEGSAERAIQIAAAKGFLEILRLFHDSKCGGWSADTMDSAAEGGHLAVVEFLHWNRSEGCSTFAMDIAARRVILRSCASSTITAKKDALKTPWTMLLRLATLKSYASSTQTVKKGTQVLRCGQLPVVIS